MAGHSKWANIKHRKAAADAKKGKVFTRAIREIFVAAKAGGGDPNMNARLRLAMDKAREGNVPKDNIDNAIKRGTGEIQGEAYEEIRYEGYGIGGAAVMIDCLTNNRTRTAGEIRHAFAKHGGNLGTDGSVAFLFKHLGVFLFAPGAATEEKVMDVALEAGADDVIANEDGSIEVLCAPGDFTTVQEALGKTGLKPDVAEVTMRASTETVLAGEDGAKMQKLLDVLESLDDVQDVYSTAAIEE